MSEVKDSGAGSARGRFRKGESGNLRGRPRAKRWPGTSAFDVVMDRRLTVSRGGEDREISVEEALQHKTYQEAIAGGAAARREVLKMIAKREKWLAAQAPREQFSLQLRIEKSDPVNADGALLLLGIAERNPRSADAYRGREQLLLEPWAVKAALGRRQSASLSHDDIADIKRCTRDAGALHWPKGREE